MLVSIIVEYVIWVEQIVNATFVQKGYVLSADKTKCECAVRNCHTCNANDGAVCDTCLDYYASYDSGVTCVRCITNYCKTCAVRGICTACYDDSPPSGGVCACPFYNCKTCSTAKCL